MSILVVEQCNNKKLLCWNNGTKYCFLRGWKFLRGIFVAIITWLFLFTPQVNYNHGQKSWDTFAFLGHFPIHKGPTPLPSPHKQCWTHVSKIFSDFQLCIGWEEGELQENFEKDALF